MIKNIFLLISLLCLMLGLGLMPGLVLADRGMVAWPPEIRLEQLAQNAIVAWNGQEELIILSSNVKSSQPATVLEMLPLPAQPSSVEEGSSEIFEKLVEVMNLKLRTDWQTLKGEGADRAAGEAGVEVTFHEIIGAHDVTIVKVNDLNEFTAWIESFAEGKSLALKEISAEFKQGLANYLKRDIKYFVFDVIQTKQSQETVEPLIYRFPSDFLYYPLLISAVSEISQSTARINLFIITDDNVTLPKNLFSYPYYDRFETYDRYSGFEYRVALSSQELREVSEDLADLFAAEVVVKKASFNGRLYELDEDLAVFPDVWDAHLTLGSSGAAVKTLQKILINEGVWEAEVEATGYFGEVTKTALAKFQEKESSSILKPLGLEQGTGFFGAMTKDFLSNISVQGMAVKKEITWQRNLSISQQGEDVKNLQEILIEEGVWQRQDVKPTGYFGSITKEAVIRFQEKHSSQILTPLGLTRGTGFVGSLTRKFLQGLVESN